MDGTIFQRLVAERPQLTKAREQYTFYADLTPVHVTVAPPIQNRPHSITAEVDIPVAARKACCWRKVVWPEVMRFMSKITSCTTSTTIWGWRNLRVTSTVDVPEGESTLRYEFEPTGPPDPRNGRGAPGRGQLYINGELVGHSEFPTTVPITFGIEGLSCGYDFGEAVTHEYHAPFRFTELLNKLSLIYPAT